VRAVREEFSALRPRGITISPFSILVSTTVGSALVSAITGSGSGGGAVMRTILSSTGAGLGGSGAGLGARRAAISGDDLRISSSSHSALILSKRAGRNFGGGNAQRLGPGKNRPCSPGRASFEIS
jgi:hypothetical protein